VKTPHGEHRFYMAPEGVTVRRKIGFAKGTDWSVDVLGEGDGAMMPPSLCWGGEGRYAFLDDSSGPAVWAPSALPGLNSTPRGLAVMVTVMAALEDGEEAPMCEIARRCGDCTGRELAAALASLVGCGVVSELGQCDGGRVAYRLYGEDERL
jgi:hypothetical protein